MGGTKKTIDKPQRRKYNITCGDTVSVLTAALAFFGMSEEPRV